MEKKDPYEGRTRQVMGRKNAYGSARKAYYLMRVRSDRRTQKHNGHLIKWLLNELGRVRSYVLTSSQIFSSPALHLGQKVHIIMSTAIRKQIGGKTAVN